MDVFNAIFIFFMQIKVDFNQITATSWLNLFSFIYFNDLFKFIIIDYWFQYWANTSPICRNKEEEPMTNDNQSKWSWRWFHFLCHRKTITITMLQFHIDFLFFSFYLYQSIPISISLFLSLFHRRNCFHQTIYKNCNTQNI